MSMPPLLHIISRDAWLAASAESHYAPEAFADEGFVHCSHPMQVLTPANERYHGQSGLVLLVIDPDKLDADLVHEDLYGSGIEFPHIYGPIVVAAVIDVIDFPSESDGSFNLPSLLAG